MKEVSESPQGHKGGSKDWLCRDPRRKKEAVLKLRDWTCRGARSPGRV